jgi:hypothetical protein
MSSTLTESPGTGIAPPARPSIWRVGWATFVGYLQTVVVGLPVALGLLALGLNVFNGAERGIFVDYDVWSWLAEACAGLLAVGLTAFFVRDSLHHRTGWEVPYWFTFVTLMLTGYAPLLALTPLYGATAPVSLAAATLILRWRAEPAGAEPRKWLGGVPRRYRRRVAIGLAVGVPVMLGYVLAYGVTHPLHTNSWYPEHKPWAFHPGKLQRYDLYLESSGPFDVSDVSVVGVEGSPALQLERVGIQARRWTIPEDRGYVPPPLHPLPRDYEPGAATDDDSALTLELRQGKTCPPGIAKLNAIRIRYTLLNGRHEQLIPLEQPPQVRCP